MLDAMILWGSLIALIAMTVLGFIAIRRMNDPKTPEQGQRARAWVFVSVVGAGGFQLGLSLGDPSAADSTRLLGIIAGLLMLTTGFLGVRQTGLLGQTRHG